MAEVTAERRLVKSPPELWSELSEVERLARHLGAFGEIKITKLEPEHAVAWEGEHASGTVSIEPSGWGTKVTLTAELAAALEPVAAAPEPEPPEPEPEPDPEPEPEPDPEPVAREPEPGAEPSEPETGRPEPERDPPEPVAVEPEPEPVTAPTPRRGFFRRLFGRRRPPEAAVEDRVEPAPEPEPVPEPVAVAVEPEPNPVAVEPEPEPVAVAEEPEPVAVAEESEPVAVEPEPVAAAAEPEPAAPEPEPHGPTLDADGAQAVLTEALDALGAAHHRPFSRG